MSNEFDEKSAISEAEFREKLLREHNGGKGAYRTDEEYIANYFGRIGGAKYQYEKDIRTMIPRERAEKLLAVLKEISKPTYGTEFIASDLEEYQSNYEIICRHYFSAQDLARKTVKEFEDT